MNLNVSGCSPSLLLSMNLALMNEPHKSLAIKRLFDEACIKKVGFENVHSTLFFVPIVFKPTEKETTLFSNFEGSSSLSKRLSRIVDKACGAEIVLFPRVLKHSEVGQFTVKTLNDILEHLTDVSVDQEVTVQQSSVSTLAFLVGVAKGKSPVSYTELNTTTMKDMVRTFIGFETSIQFEQFPDVCGFYPYTESLVQGSIAVVNSFKIFVNSLSMEKMNDCDVRVDFDLGQKNTKIIIDGEVAQGRFQLDDDRIGKDGISRVIKAVMEGSVLFAHSVDLPNASFMIQ